jgi:hypothetical protein
MSGGNTAIYCEIERTGEGLVVSLVWESVSWVGKKVGVETAEFIWLRRTWEDYDMLWTGKDLVRGYFQCIIPIFAWGNREDNDKLREATGSVHQFPVQILLQWILPDRTDTTIPMFGHLLYRGHTRSFRRVSRNLMEQQFMRELMRTRMEILVISNLSLALSPFYPTYQCLLQILFILSLRWSGKEVLPAECFTRRCKISVMTASSYMQLKI